MGKHQLRLLRFAIRYPGWHGYGKDRSTVDAVNGLEYLGLLEISRETRQFRLVPSEYTAGLEAAATRMIVGITKQSVPSCEWYDGIEHDGATEASKLIGINPPQVVEATTG
jgi:hypothetical protein